MGKGMEISYRHPSGEFKFDARKILKDVGSMIVDVVTKNIMDEVDVNGERQKKNKRSTTLKKIAAKVKYPHKPLYMEGILQDRSTYRMKIGQQEVTVSIAPIRAEIYTELRERGYRSSFGLGKEHEVMIGKYVDYRINEAIIKMAKSKIITERF